MPRISFPDGFDFGVATSAYQIEGAWNLDGKGPSIWDTFSHTPGKVWRDIPGGDVAVDHYHRFRDDVALMKDLGLDSYRFSLSWSRIMPEGAGAVNQAGLDFYKRLIDELRTAGISPNVTLYHWDLPQALEDRGGWVNRDIAGWFGDYAALAFDELGESVPRWSTLNEPIAIWVGYGMGVFAPGHVDHKAGKQAMHNALLAHGTAVQAFRASAASPGDIGVVLDIWQRHPASDAAADLDIAQRDEDDSFRFFLEPLLTGAYGDRIVNRLEERGLMPDVHEGDLDLIAQPLDFLGLNVYSRVVVSAENYNPQWWVAGDSHPGGNFLDNGMEFYPKSVYDAIFMVRDDYGFDKPIYITENGVADNHGDSVDGPIHDEERIRYIAGFLEWIARAIEDGADVRGYYLWSLMDNFEWAAGFSQRFGLVHVDTDTLERTPKASASWYARVIAQRGFESRPASVDE
ncbi:MAG: GH1 family beta-glucosidase [Microcella pacifica]|jgi:beta-glucosidase|uniref:GH1 family beta-glucosidase n=1 Tax=Microcella pacifica TaxID=2591847 RepID=UPI0026D29B6A